MLFVLLESTHFKVEYDSENGKWIKMDLIHFIPGPFNCVFYAGDW
jgi:hypothetical protein